uniref:Uncharacterized protein n=1 Tax=Aegilops tauschii subsp. strangulata TaxID=200361 RepID=A0A453LVA2_AEGTS
AGAGLRRLRRLEPPRGARRGGGARARRRRLRRRRRRPGVRLRRQGPRPRRAARGVRLRWRWRGPRGAPVAVGLKRVLVAAGVALKITGAQRVFFSHPHSIGLLANGSLVATNKDLRQILPLSHSTCAPLLHMRVVGSSVTIVAHETNVSGGHMKPLLTSDDAIELLSDQSEVSDMSDRLISACAFCSVSPRLPRLEKLLKTWFSERNGFNRTMNFFEARVTSMTLVKFRLELERDITEEDDIWDDVPEWKTLPVVQRITLDVIARVEEEGRLKAISVKKVRKSLQIADATSWSSLTSNVSFADFTSLVLPPDPLSLDVKW